MEDAAMQGLFEDHSNFSQDSENNVEDQARSPRGLAGTVITGLFLSVLFGGEILSELGGILLGQRPPIWLRFLSTIVCALIYTYISTKYAKALSSKGFILACWLFSLGALVAIVLFLIFYS
jgi:hypothetical protein